jgi:NAD kinase
VSGNDRKVVLVVRRTRLEELITRFLTADQARFYVEHLGADFSDYEREHAAYQAARLTSVQTLERWGRYQIVDRGFLPNFIFGPADIVAALGPDGLVANTMKYLDGQPLLGLNPDAARHDGVLLPFAPADLASLLPEVAADRRAAKAVTMARASLADGQVLHAVNDLFIGARTHVSARYEIATREHQERQSSSGLIVATGLGSTAWFKSIVTHDGRRLHRPALGRPELALCRARAVPEQDVTDIPGLRRAERRRNTAPALADARERRHFLRRHRGGSPRFQCGDRSGDRDRGATGPADRVVRFSRSICSWHAPLSPRHCERSVQPGDIAYTCSGT